MISISMQTGNPATNDPVCNAMRPPPKTSVAATTPSVKAQNTRNLTSVLSLPPLVIKSMIREPLSEEVTKNKIIQRVQRIVVKEAKGKRSSNAKMAVGILEATTSESPPEP